MVLMVLLRSHWIEIDILSHSYNPTGLFFVPLLKVNNSAPQTRVTPTSKAFLVCSLRNSQSTEDRAQGKGENTHPQPLLVVWTY